MENVTELLSVVGIHMNTTIYNSPFLNCVSCGSGWSVPCVSIQLNLYHRGKKVRARGRWYTELKGLSVFRPQSKMAGEGFIHVQE